MDVDNLSRDQIAYLLSQGFTYEQLKALHPSQLEAIVSFGGDIGIMDMANAFGQIADIPAGMLRTKLLEPYGTVSKRYWGKDTKDILEKYSDLIQNASAPSAGQIISREGYNPKLAGSPSIAKAYKAMMEYPESQLGKVGMDVLLTGVTDPSVGLGGLASLSKLAKGKKVANVLEAAAKYSNPKRLAGYVQEKLAKGAYMSPDLTSNINVAGGGFRSLKSAPTWPSSVAFEYNQFPSILRSQSSAWQGTADKIMSEFNSYLEDAVKRGVKVTPEQIEEIRKKVRAVIYQYRSPNAAQRAMQDVAEDWLVNATRNFSEDAAIQGYQDLVVKNKAAIVAAQQANAAKLAKMNEVQKSLGLPEYKTLPAGEEIIPKLSSENTFKVEGVPIQDFAKEQQQIQKSMGPTAWLENFRSYEPFRAEYTEAGRGAIQQAVYDALERDKIGAGAARKQLGKKLSGVIEMKKYADRPADWARYIPAPLRRGARVAVQYPTMTYKVARDVAPNLTDSLTLEALLQAYNEQRGIPEEE